MNKVDSSGIKLTGNMVRNLRLQNGWSGEVLAYKIHQKTNQTISKHTIYKWEKKGEKNINPHPHNSLALSELIAEGELMDSQSLDDLTSNNCIVSNKLDGVDAFTRLVENQATLETKPYVSGEYYSQWGFGDEKTIERINFRTVGKILVGEIIQGDVKYVLQGYLFSDGLFMGFWINTYNIYKGTVMLKFKMDYREAEGNWHGNFDRGELPSKKFFMDGYWKITKIDNEDEF